MRWSFLLLFVCFSLSAALQTCVSPIDTVLNTSLNVLVVSGTITDLAEPQEITLSRSVTDPLSGRLGVVPVTKAQVEVIIDSLQVIPAHETVDGTYQLPTNFRGQINHAYQLRFTTSDGNRYQSSQQFMPASPPIRHVTAQFNPSSVSPPFSDNLTAGHDVFIDVQDPANQINFYRWDWVLYEPQDWCCSCYEGFYAVDSLADLLHNGTFFSLAQPYEKCFNPPTYTTVYEQLKNGYLDYPCRTQCWEVLYSHIVNVFSDQFSNGGLLTHQLVARIPFYQHQPCLVSIRQQALTATAYRYFNQLQQQTQNAGGVADAAPTILPGNVYNIARSDEPIVGYFTAAGVTVIPYYIDRKDTQGFAPGLFYALNGRNPSPELQPPLGPYLSIHDPSPSRPPTALCAPIDQRTPLKPTGWPN